MNTRAGWIGRVYEDFEVGDVYEHPLGRTAKTTGLNQDGAVVIEFKRTFMVYKRGFLPERAREK